MKLGFSWWARNGAVLLLLLLTFTLVGCDQANRPTAKSLAPSAASKPAVGAGQSTGKTPSFSSAEKANGAEEKQATEPVPEPGQKVLSEEPLGAPASAKESLSKEGTSKNSASGFASGALPQSASAAEQRESSVESAATEPPGFIREADEELPFPFEIPSNWKRLSDKEEIWIDSQEKLVAVSGRICLTRGLLEMFACPKGTKEHESIVATKPWAMYVHQALLLAGVNPGRTVQWDPEYKPAEGPRISVEVWYFNEQKELVKKNAKEMVRLVADGSPLKIDWVFGGSKFITDPDGRELYAANGGELICLSNFSSAMIDLPIPSTAEAGALLFEANPDQIPPLNTPVLLVLKADAKADPKAAGSGPSQPESSGSAQTDK